jgi:hypothetical protein
VTGRQPKSKHRLNQVCIDQLPVSKFGDGLAAGADQVEISCGFPENPICRLLDQHPSPYFYVARQS